MGQQYIIPVVVHVIHDYGVENISDEQIARAMETVMKTGMLKIMI